MVRLKFATFAVAVLVVWLWQLYALAPTLGERAKGAAAAQAGRAPAALGIKIDERRREFHRAALKIASAPAALSALHTRADPPTPERLAPIQAAALEETPEAYRGSLLVLLSNEHGTAFSRGGAEPVANAGGLDPVALGQAGMEGLWQEAFGSMHLFFSFPVAGFDRGEPKVVANLVLGAPLQIEGLLDGAAKEAGLGAIAVLRGGKVLSLGGPEKPTLDKQATSLVLGKTDVVVRGSLMKLGFLSFPMATSGDAFGGKAPLWVGSRQPIRGTPYEVIGYAATRAVMEPLAAYQRVTVLLFFALLGLAVAVGLFIEAQGYRIPARRAARESGLRAGFATGEVRSAERTRTGSLHAPAPPASLADEPPPVPPSAIDAAAVAKPRATGAHSAALRSAEPQPKAADGYGPYAEDNQPTTLYPSTLFGEDISGLAAAQPRAGEPPAAEAESYPDATRVQEMPEELIRASARVESEPEPPPEPAPPAISPPAPPSDEQHFREVFREFLAAREKCGEPADGLTYDRFALKLRKNRDQLIQKYNCRTVRFQVYVKEGKAALRAAPVKS
jgi:hypothetical protein